MKNKYRIFLFFALTIFKVGVKLIVWSCGISAKDVNNLLINCLQRGFSAGKVKKKQWKDFF